MESVPVCIYCDNKIIPGSNKCYVCEADITKDLEIINTKKESHEPRNSTVPSSTFSFNYCDNEIYGKVLEDVSVVRAEDLKILPAVQKAEIVKKSSEVLRPLQVQVESKESRWPCSYCTFLNKSNSLCCEACFKGKVSYKTCEEDKKEVGPTASICPKKEVCPTASICSKKEVVSTASICSKKTVDPTTSICPKKEVVPTGWICPSCQCNNGMDKEYCAACLRQNVKDIPQSNTMTTNTTKIDNITIDSHKWHCMNCKYCNDMPALKCFGCSVNNQIYRICNKCKERFIMNDVDNVCLDCSLYNSVAVVNDNDIVPTNKLKNNKKKSSESPRKMSLTKKLFSKPFKKEKWLCGNENCETKNKVELHACKQCGLSRGDTMDCAVTEDKKEGGLESIPSGAKKAKIKVRFPLFRGLKGKSWYCCDEHCRTKNAKKDVICRSCGLSKPPPSSFRTNIDDGQMDSMGKCDKEEEY